jgi:hypothetical protein
MRSYYDTLGLKPQASADEIRLAYRRIAKERHPDMAAGSETAMRQLNDAYETLRDPERRQVYDRTLAHPAKAATRRAPAPPPPLDPETFWERVFRPLDREVVSALRDLQEALADLMDAPDDDEAITAFDLVVETADKVLTRALSLLASLTWPPALVPVLTRYRDGLREAVTAVEDLGRYSLDLDEILLEDGQDRLQRAVVLLSEGRRR